MTTVAETTATWTKIDKWGESRRRGLRRRLSRAGGSKDAGRRLVNRRGRRNGKREIEQERDMGSFGFADKGKYLTYAYMKDLVVEIRCARRDWPDDEEGYVKYCISQFRRIWKIRHRARIGSWGVPE